MGKLRLRIWFLLLFIFKIGAHVAQAGRKLQYVAKGDLYIFFKIYFYVGGRGGGEYLNMCASCPRSEEGVGSPEMVVSHLVGTGN